MVKRHRTLVIADDEMENLERMARVWGYLQTRGCGAGRVGSVSALMSAIARGDLELTRAGGEPPSFDQAPPVFQSSN